MAISRKNNLTSFTEDGDSFRMYEDGDSFGGDVMSQNEALANIINPPAPPTPPAKPAQPAGPSAEILNALTQQILGSSDTSKWTGQGFGSAQANAADMAKILANAGITDVRQLGVKQEVVPAQYFESGETPEHTVNKYYNKETGQDLGNLGGTYAERQTGNFFGGTFTGKGNTGYGVQFRPDGTPVFYTQGASSNDLAKIMEMAGPVGQIAIAVATAGMSIPAQIATQAAIQILSGVDPADVVKNVAVNMVVSNIPGSDAMKGVNKAITDLGLDAATTKILTNSVQTATASAARAAITGQSIGDAVLAGAATGGINGAINVMMNTPDIKEITKDLSAVQKRMVETAISGVISGRPLDQAIINAAIAGASAEAREQAKHPPLSEEDVKELKPAEKEIYDQSGTKGLKTYRSNQRIERSLNEINAGSTVNTDSGLSNQDIADMIGAGGNDTVSSAGTDTLPSGTQLAAVGSGNISDAGNGLNIQGGGEDTLTTEIDNLLSNPQLKADEDLFKSGEGTLDTVTSGAGNDVVNNLLDAGLKETFTDDQVSSIVGATGNDTLVGADGNDTVSSDDTDTVVAGSGEDTIDYGDDDLNELLNGTVAGGDTNDTIAGEGGTDTSTTETDTVNVVDGTGTDTMSDDEINDFIDNLTSGGTGNDTVTDNLTNDDILRLIGAESLIGGTTNDSIAGGTTNDELVITGGAGNDVIESGAGNDVIGGTTLTPEELESLRLLNLISAGAGGTDTLAGGTGNDNVIVTGAAGNDSVEGGDTNDSVIGGTGNSVVGLDINDLIGATNNDNIIVTGAAGNDSVSDGDTNDSIVGGLGNSVIGGTDSGTVTVNDKKCDPGYVYDEERKECVLIEDTDTSSITGGTGTGTGGTGTVTIVGGRGNDVITGGEGNDSIEGGLGNSSIGGTDHGTVTIVGGRETCPAGTRLNELTGNCDPYWDETGTDTTTGGTGNDSIGGGTGNDTVAGGGGLRLNFDPVQALGEFYNPYTYQAPKAPSQIDTGPIQLMTDIFGTDISKANKTGARGYELDLAKGGDIDELLRILRSKI